MRKCNYCEEKYSSSTLTGHLIKHLKTSHCMSFNQTVLTADEIYQIDSLCLYIRRVHSHSPDKLLLSYNY